MGWPWHSWLGTPLVWRSCHWVGGGKWLSHGWACVVGERVGMANFEIDVCIPLLPSSVSTLIHTNTNNTYSMHCWWHTSSMDPCQAFKSLPPQSLGSPPLPSMWHIQLLVPFLSLTLAPCSVLDTMRPWMDAITLVPMWTRCWYVVRFVILSPQPPATLLPFLHTMCSASHAFPQPNATPWRCLWCHRTTNGCSFTCGLAVGVSFCDFLSPAPYHTSTLPSCNAPCFLHLSSTQHHPLATFLTICGHSFTCGLAISQFDPPTLAALIQACCVLPQLNYTPQQCFLMVLDCTWTLVCMGLPLRKFPQPHFLMSITSTPNTSSLPTEKSYKIQLIYFTFRLRGGSGEPIRSRGEMASGMRQRGRRGSLTWWAWCGLQPSSPGKAFLTVDMTDSASTWLVINFSLILFLLS